MVVAHFDHQLRPDSSQDAETVRRVAEALGLPFVLGSQDVAGYARKMHLSLEEAARELRYRFLFAQARQYAAQAVLVGHTADDQVETVLMHLLRGAGLAGLKGMPFTGLMPIWDAEIPLARPLLSFWRQETLDYCEEHGLAPVFDPSNQDAVYFRNRVRNELIPFLETLNPQIRQNLWRTAQILAGDEAVIQDALANALDTCQVEQRDGSVSLSLMRLQGLPVGLQRMVLRNSAAHLQPALRDLDFAAIERALRFVQSPGSGQIDLVHGLRIFVEEDRLWMVAANQTLPPEPDWLQLGRGNQPLPVPGEVDLQSGWKLVGAWVNLAEIPLIQGHENSAFEAWLDRDTLPEGFVVRCAQPGDRFQPLGMEGHSLKISDFWINQKLPRRARKTWPLVTSGETVVWIPGFRLAHPFRITKDTRQALHLRVFKVEK